MRIIIHFYEQMTVWNSNRKSEKMTSKRFNKKRIIIRRRNFFTLETHFVVIIFLYFFFFSFYMNIPKLSSKIQLLSFLLLFLVAEWVKEWEKKVIMKYENVINQTHLLWKRIAKNLLLQLAAHAKMVMYVGWIHLWTSLTIFFSFRSVK